MHLLKWINLVIPKYLRKQIDSSACISRYANQVCRHAATSFHVPCMDG
jgi:hypothetical protein